MEEHYNQLETTNNLLRHLSRHHIQLRNRLFETFKRGLEEEYNQSFIVVGNNMAHGGDVMADISIFKSSARIDT